MALLVLNPKSLDLEMKVGVLENYKPSKEIKKAVKLSEQLKAEVQSKLTELVGEERESVKVMNLLEASPEKKEDWQKFLQGEFAEKMQKLQKDIGEINRKICPNIDELK